MQVNGTLGSCVVFARHPVWCCMACSALRFRGSGVALPGPLSKVSHTLTSRLSCFESTYWSSAAYRTGSLVSEDLLVNPTLKSTPDVLPLLCSKSFYNNSAVHRPSTLHGFPCGSLFSRDASFVMRGHRASAVLHFCAATLAALQWKCSL